MQFSKERLPKKYKGESDNESDCMKTGLLSVVKFRQKI